MPQMFCVVDEGGLALLTRAQGDIQTPSFPAVGLLSSIATYTNKSGHELRVIASTNVRVIYRRFDNHLLFVLVTSNLLLQTELLQLHLQTLFDALLLLLGSAALVLDTTAKIDVLKRKLRAPSIQRAVDSLIADDTLVPCILLPVPQLVGLPLRDKAVLQGALAKVVATLGCKHAALISEGYYMAASNGWWTQLSPREQMLIQHVATQQAEDQDGDAAPELPLYVGKRQNETPLLLRWLSLQDGVLLVALFEPGEKAPPPLQESEMQLRSHLQPASHTLTPLWMSPPVPQFASITFDLALIVEHSPPAATLLWGHTGSAMQQGFNPLISPTVRKQMDNPTSPMLARISHRPSSAHREESAPVGSDGLQLFFRSAVDTLISFLLQAWPQMPPALQAALHGSLRPEGPNGPGSDAHGGQVPAQQPHAPPQREGRSGSPTSRLGKGAGNAATRQHPNSAAGTSRLQSLFGRSGGGSAAAAEATSAGLGGSSGLGGGGDDASQWEPAELADVPYEEVHAVIEGARLLALLDRTGALGGCGTSPGSSGGGVGSDSAVDVFMVFPRRIGRVAALEAATTLRATFLMAYHDDD